MDTERATYDWLTEAIERKQIAELRASFAATREGLLTQRAMIAHALPQAEEAIAIADAALATP